MSEKSPLFISAIELVAHSVELLLSGNVRKNKFAILHLANSIELILKDLLVDHGTSIYQDKGKMTINVWAAFSYLEEHAITFPERPRLEMLIDDRNAIQHRFGYPDKETVLYYLSTVVTTMDRLMKEVYHLNAREIFSQYMQEEALTMIGFSPARSPLGEARAIAEIDPASGMSTAYGLLEKRLFDLLPDYDSQRPVMPWHSPHFRRIMRNISSNLLSGQDALSLFEEIRKLRGVAVHRQHYDESKMRNQMLVGIDKVEMLLGALDSLPKQEVGSD